MAAYSSLLLHVTLVYLLLVEALDATSTSHVSISFGDTDISYMHDHDVPAYYPPPPPPYHDVPAYYPQEPVYQPEPYQPEPYQPKPYQPEPYQPKPVHHAEPVYKPEPVHEPEPEQLEEPKLVIPVNKPELVEPKKPITTPKPAPVPKSKPIVTYKPKPKPTKAPEPSPIEYGQKEPQQPEPYQPEPYQPQPHQPEPYQPEPYQPEPYQPEPYQPESYQPEPYQPEPYQPEPYHPKPVHHQPKPSYKHHHEVPSCSELTNNTWCIEDDEYPEYDIKHAIQYHLDTFNGFYADVADLNTVLSVERPNTLEEETYLCPSETSYIRPLRALNTEGKWRVVINNVNLHYKTFTQNARVEQCLSGGDICPKVPLCYDSKCLQKSIYVRLLIFDAYDQYFPFAIETFKLPASCACLLGAYTINH